MNEKDFYNIVYIDDTYTNFLHDIADHRVSFNNSQNYQRPYLGVIFALNSQCYFAPMTTSHKGEKLLLNPKPEDITFLPINNCENGGINFNNMIPVNERVFHKADLVLKPSDPKWLHAKKLNLILAQRFIRRNSDKIVAKAITLYDMKTMRKLSQKENNRTCNFKRLELAFGYYGAFVGGELSADEIMKRLDRRQVFVKTSLQAPTELSPEDKRLLDKYPITREKLEQIKRVAESIINKDSNKKGDLENCIRANIKFAPEVYGKEWSDKIAREDRQKKQRTQEKTVVKTLPPKPTPKKPTKPEHRGK